MTTKHTPGPWFANLKNDGGFEITDMKDCWEATVLCSRFAYAEKEKEFHANARLIAAAPDLLAALEKVMAHNIPFSGNPTHAEQVEFWEYEKIEGRGDADDMLEALAAIAKATGAA